MTKKQKLRRNSFTADFNGREDDLILADLDVMLEEEPSPVPLNHFFDDEETIDRLLIKPGFEVNDEQEEDRELDTLVIDDTDLTDECSGFDQFVIEPLKQAEHNQQVEIEENAASDFYLMADFDEIADEEDAIDRLLVNAGFDDTINQEQVDGKPDAWVIDDIRLDDGVAKFIIEPMEQTEQNQQAQIEEMAASDFYLMADFDEIADGEDAIDRLLVHAGFNELKEDDGALKAMVIDDISQADEFGVNIEERNVMVADAGIFDSDESELTLNKGAANVKEENPETSKHEQALSETIYQNVALERLNNDAGLASFRADKSEQESIKKQINEYFEDQNSIATDTGITALSSVRSERNATKKQINDYEHKVKKAAIITYTSLSFASIALLSTVIMGVIISSMQTKISKLTELVSILEEDMSNIIGKNSDLEINNNVPSVEQLNQKTNGLPEQIEEQTQPLPDISENVKTEAVTKQATGNKANDEQQSKTPVLKNKKSSEVSLNKVLAEKKGNTTQPATSWSVNLNAYEDQSYAKSKAEKFIQKGIPVKVITVNMNNAKWYRLKVGGFKNEEEATSYAAKIKKSLNLNTVFVGKN